MLEWGWFFIMNKCNLVYRSISWDQTVSPIKSMACHFPKQWCLLPFWTTLWSLNITATCCETQTLLFQILFYMSSINGSFLWINWVETVVKCWGRGKPLFLTLKYLNVINGIFFNFSFHLLFQWLWGQVYLQRDILVIFLFIFVTFRWMFSITV